MELKEYLERRINESIFEIKDRLELSALVLNNDSYLPYRFKDILEIYNALNNLHGIFVDYAGFVENKDEDLTGEFEIIEYQREEIARIYNDLMENISKLINIGVQIIK